MAKMNYYHLLYDGQYDRVVTEALPVAETDEDARRESFLFPHLIINSACRRPARVKEHGGGKVEERWGKSGGNEAG